MHAAPAVSCANSAQKTHTSIQVQSEHSGIPCAMALRLMPSSPRRRIRLVTVVWRIEELIKPGWADASPRRLGTSNGCQDHTVLPYATSAVRLARCCSLTEEPPCEHTSRARRCRVHRIPSRVRDDRDTPLVRDETAGFLALIWGDREGNCFRGRDWTGQIALNWLGKLAFACNGQAWAQGMLPIRRRSEGLGF